VAQKVWHPIAVSIPASEARCRTMFQTFPRSTGLSVSCADLPIAERNSGPLRSRPVSAAVMYASRYCSSGSRALRLQQFDICGHMHGLDMRECGNPLPLTPA